jgi:predicted alpha/beta hydrolase family esterase
MAKRIFLIHGWGGSPELDWLPWMKKELEQRGFNVIAPKMPETDAPKIEKWVPFLANLVKTADRNTYFVGHSIGCQTILRYLETVKGKVGGAVFVAGWLTLTGLETKEEKEIARPWLDRPIDFEKVRKTSKNFVAIFSDNDPYVPLENTELFRETLGAKVVIEKNKGHFTRSEDVLVVPTVLKEILSLLK